MLDRCEAKVDAVQTPIGYLPNTQDINLQGLICDRERMKQLLEIDQQQWLDEIADLRAYFAEQGQTLAEFECVLDSMQSRLQ
jgi:phosphoenolpyruvate carboxykinase (GTP)